MGLLELLIQYGTEESFADPTHAEEIFRLALEVSSYLDIAFYGKGRIEDMRARTLGHIANTYRIRMELPTSEEMFKEAWRRLQKGTDDVMERALLLEQQVSLRRSQRRVEEALQLSCRAISIYDRAGDVHRVGRVLLNQSVVYYVDEDPQKAHWVLGQSFGLLDFFKEPRVAILAFHNLATYLSADGRLMEAQRVLTQVRSLYQRFPDPRLQCRRKWVEGMMVYRLGRHQEAKALLAGARNEFISVGASFEADLVSRDMASFGLQ